MLLIYWPPDENILTCLQLQLGMFPVNNRKYVHLGVIEDDRFNYHTVL